jgi:hypothetical protein
MSERLDTSFLDDAMQYASREARHTVADALACHLHNDGYALEGNLEANDVEWFARLLWNEDAKPIRERWDTLGDSDRERYRRRRRRCLARHRARARPLARHRHQSRRRSARAPRREPSDVEHYPENVWKVDPVGVRRPAGRADVALAGLQALLESEGRQAGQQEDSLARVGRDPLGEGRAAARDGPRERRGVSGWGPVLRETNKPCPKRKGRRSARSCAKLERSRLSRRVARAPRVRLRRADDSEASLPDRALRRQADRVARADARQGTRAAVAHRGRVHRLVDSLPVDLPDERRSASDRR